MTIAIDLRFEAAHRLPQVPEGHKCGRLHGHSYRVEVHVAGPVNPVSGWVMDYAEVRAACEPLRLALDHRHLNDIDGLQNPTSEVLAAWIWQRLVDRLPGLEQLVVHETCTTRCTLRRTEAST